VNRTLLSSHRRIVAELAQAERGGGWLAACEEAARFLMPSQELIDALVEALSPLPKPVLEVCAGRGDLAEALRRRGIDVIAADADPPPGAAVDCSSAAQALRQYQPATVLGCFVPIDSGVDRAVLASPRVQSYLVLGARLNSQLGSRELWETPGWAAMRLARVTRWMITRHDVWLGEKRGVLRHGEAWLFRRSG
jgi:hypothetical protein